MDQKALLSARDQPLEAEWAAAGPVTAPGFADGADPLPPPFVSPDEGRPDRGDCGS